MGGIRRRNRILNAGKSPSIMAMERTYKRAISNGGVTQDFSANVENIREISRKLGYNILKTSVLIDNSKIRNLLSNSSMFLTLDWDKVAITVTENANLNPFGVNKSYYLTDTNISTNNSLSQKLALQIGLDYTASWYVKKAEDSWIQFTFGGNAYGTNRWANFNFDSGVFGNKGSTGIWIATSLSDGWWRISTTVTPSVSTNQNTLTIAGTNNTNSTTRLLVYTAANRKIIDVAAMQFELGSMTTDYQETLGSFPVELDITNANFLYVPSSYGESKNFAQVQNKRNLLLWSEEFDNAAWTKSAATVTANITIAPNGTLTADKLVASVSGSGSVHSVNQGSSVVSNTNYTYSVFAKAGEHTAVCIVATASAFGSNIFATYDLTNGSSNFSGGGTNVSIHNTHIANGWYLCSITLTAITSTASLFQIRTQQVYGSGDRPFAGDGVSGIYIWGAQQEQGIYATPYQKTVASGDGIVDFNFTRATAARVTNKQGVIEDSCYNLLQRSEEFTNAIWTKTGTTITTNAIANPVSGAINASKLVETAATIQHLITNYVSNISNPISTTYEGSVYIKAGERTTAVFGMGNSAGSFGQTAIIDLTNGSVLSGTANVNYVRDGWYHISKTYTSNDNGTSIKIYVNNTTGSYAGDGVSGIYIWGAQITVGSIPRPYLRTTNRLNVPRLDYSRGTGEPELLIEKASTNLVTQSEDFTQAVWNKGATTISLNSNSNPFGVNKSYYLLEDNTNAIHYLGHLNTPSTVGNIYSISFYVKKADDTWVQFLAGNSAFGANDWINFNFDTGLFGNGGGAGIWSSKQLLNGYWILTVTITSIATGSFTSLSPVGTNNTNSLTRAPSYTGTTGHRIVDVSAIQYEIGSIATTYIPTTTAAVTRNAENSYVDLWNNATLNRTNWTLFWEGYLHDGVATTASFVLSDSTTAASNTNQIGWTGAIQPFYNVSNVRTNGGASTVNNTFNRFAIQQNNGAVNFFSNGLKIWNTTVSTFDYRYLALNSGGSTYTTDKISLFNRTLTDTECINLTQNASVTFAPFISTWDTNNTSVGSSATNQVKLPLVSTGVYAMQVEWGDGTTSAIGVWNQAETTHTYITAGTYTITITGTCAGWSFNNTGDRLKILSIQQWGNLRLGNTANYFYGCSNLTLSSVVDILDLTGTTNLTALFRSCSSLTTINRINEWNVSNVTTMLQCFMGASNFNQDLGGWNMSNVTSIGSMFNLCPLFNNGGSSSINNWNVSKVTVMTFTFFGATAFNQNLSSWNVSNVTSMSDLFNGATSFNQNLSAWNVSKVTSFFQMFLQAYAFNNGLASGVAGIMNWTLDGTTISNMGRMFEQANSFNQNLSSWNVSSVTYMAEMFQAASKYNNGGASLNSWNVSKVTDFTTMFNGAANFNNGLGIGVAGIMNWTLDGTTSSVMTSMFDDADWFDQDISSWNVSNVTNMSAMFLGAARYNNGGVSLNSWDVSKVINFSNMFFSAPLFNNGLASGVAGTMSWTINSIVPVTMTNMFSGATSFNQDVSSWNMTQVTTTAGMFNGANKFNQNLSNWERVGSSLSNVTTMSTMFNNASIFNQPIGNWNVSKVTSMNLTFSGCTLFNQDLSSWNVSKVTDFTGMFNVSGFDNGGSDMINNWVINTTSNVIMTSMFNQCPFSREIGGWNVSKVTSFASFKRFGNAGGAIFNPNLSGWDTSSCTTMSQMFHNCLYFNADISGWDVSKVTDMTNMFYQNHAFNRNLGNWNISNVTTFGTLFMGNVNLSLANMDAIYNGWSTKPVKPNLSINFDTIKHTAASSAGKAILTGAPNNWIIIDGGI